MMRKINYLILGAAALAMASCSNDEVRNPAADGNYTVRVQLPADMATRAAVTPTANEYGQGYEAQRLFYYVYECDQEGEFIRLVTQGDTSFPENELETEVGFSLANGKYYQIAFFAESVQAEIQKVYEIDPETTTMTVNYENMVYGSNNVDGYDCFYRLYETGRIGDAATNSSPTVYLYRPVAQINWGTNDYGQPVVMDENAFGEDAASNIETYFTADVYTQFNMKTSNVTGTPTTQNFQAMAVPTVKSFPVQGYNYLAMQYVLAPAAENNQEEGGYVYDLNLNVKSTLPNVGHNIDVVVDNVPVQANWRTNIYGSLLTDNFNIHVVKEPTFWGEYEVLVPWGGNATQPDINGNTVTINRASDLAGLGRMLGDGYDFTGKTVTLAGDLDMGSEEGEVFPGIGSGTRSSANVSGNSFTGVFDGAGHTIRNLKIAYTGTDKNAVVGFIASLSGSTAKVTNVNFENVSIDGGSAEQAGIIGTVTGGATVSEVTVTGGSVTSAESAGAIVGRMIKSGTIENCHNVGVAVNGTANVGGIVGSAYYNSADEYQLEISGCTNTGAVTSAGNCAGGIVGLSAANVSGCTNEGAVVGTQGVGGIVGIAATSGTISGNENSALITGTNYVGGIAGWITYYGAPNYGHFEVVTITENTNTGNLVAGTGSAGGILGMSQNKGNVTDNTNEATSIKGGTVAGIVGTCSPSTGTNIWSGGLTITGNTSTTTEAQLEGSKWNLIYNGTAETVSGNTPQ